VFGDEVVAKAMKDLALYEQEVEHVRVELASHPEFRIRALY
jgi:hypothetical protein